MNREGLTRREIEAIESDDLVQRCRRLQWRAGHRPHELPRAIDDSIPFPWRAIGIGFAIGLIIQPFLFLLVVSF